MKHRNLHKTNKDEPEEYRLRLGKVAQAICADLKTKPEAIEQSEPQAIRLPQDSEDYKAYLESFDVRN